MLSLMAQDSVDALQQDWNDQRPDLDSDAMGIVLRIQALDKILGDQAAESLQAFGLQWWQYDVLSALRRQGLPYQMAATELAAASRLTSGAMTNRIDRLENSSLVRRLHDSDDRRRVIVRLTREGRRLIDQALEARFEMASAALASLDDHSRRQLSDLLRQLLLAQEGQEHG
jgi:DNA-binding MarR family transcriptional regulator